ncbi:MAG: alanine racemase [Pseudomonadota bacterium]
MTNLDKIGRSLTRRNLMLGGAGVVGAAGVGALASRKSDASGPRQEYYLAMQDALMRAGVGTPTLVIDEARLNANIDALIGALPEGMSYRIVAKSLPSLDLISRVSQRTGSKRLMTFNLSMLEALSDDMPEADQMLGKPLPVAAARSYFQDNSFLPRARGNVQWLIDSPERLKDYLALADSNNEPMRINIELDVGLHRGGVTPDDGLGDMLTMIKEQPNLIFSGLMGYEPHVGGVPVSGGRRERAFEQALNIYRASLAQVKGILGESALDGATLNAAGSSTFKLYKNTEVANEVAVGTALVKPNHYDIDALSDFAASSFIATPVIKSFEETRLAGQAPWRDSMRRFFDPNLDHTIFVFGGNWKADPVDPKGLRHNHLSPRSSNQDMLNGGQELNIKRGEFVFFRPHQSEAVFLQFGDIALYRDDEIVEYWPVFPAAA